VEVSGVAGLVTIFSPPSFSFSFSFNNFYFFFSRCFLHGTDSRISPNSLLVDVSADFCVATDAIVIFFSPGFCLSS